MTLKVAARNCVHGTFVFFGSIRINDLIWKLSQISNTRSPGNLPPPSLFFWFRFGNFWFPRGFLSLNGVPINNTLPFHPQLLVYRSRNGVPINNLLPKFMYYFYDSVQ